MVEILNFKKGATILNFQGISVDHCGSDKNTENISLNWLISSECLLAYFGIALQQKGSEPSCFSVVTSLLSSYQHNFSSLAMFCKSLIYLLSLMKQWLWSRTDRSESIRVFFEKQVVTHCSNILYGTLTFINYPIHKSLHANRYAAEK
jgi:hypothetical protein